MMDTRPHDSKRIRADPNAWTAANDPRTPGAHSYPQSTLPQPQRRHSQVQQHYDNEARRQSQPVLYDPYGGAQGPRDPSIKTDPNDRPPLQNSRSHSTGHLTEGRPKPPPPGDLRVQAMTPYDHPPPGPPQGQAHYIQPPPQSPLYPPGPPGQYYDGNIYDQNGVERTQEQTIMAEYTGISSSNAQKKRAPRTSQACESCRIAKAKCTDPKPCQGCVEKGIHCKYDPPAPKQTDRAQSDIMNRLDELMNTLHEMRHNMEESLMKEARKRMHLEKTLISLVPSLSASLGAFDDETGEFKVEEMDTGLDRDMKRPAKRRSLTTNGISPPKPQLVMTGGVEDLENGSDNEIAVNVPPGEPAIPIGHTTGAAKILQWPAVAYMVGDKMKKDRNRGLDPMRREIRRGVIRLYWRGEGGEKSVGYDRDSVSDYNPEHPRPSSDTYSDMAHSPAMDHPWSQGGGASPVADSMLYQAEMEARDTVDVAGFPQLDENTVKHLAGSYMRNLNVMHPIITQKSLDAMISKFLKQIGQPERDATPHDFAAYVGGSEKAGSKRKRSPTITAPDRPSAQQPNVTRQFQTITEAIVLLILALGQVCEYRHKIPDVVPHNDNPTATTTSSPSNTFSPQTMHQSPQMSSHSSTLPSPTMPDRNRNRRASVDNTYNNCPPHTRNLDVIPGLSYFAVAMGILGIHFGSTGLSYVHACLLAGLYQSQLGRVLQSHALIKEAGYALTIMLRQHLSRYKKMQEDMGHPDRQKDVKWYPQDNRLLFTYWTCLQLESDIVAELEVPHSGVLTHESLMPWPNLQMAIVNGEMSSKEVRCYGLQLIFRKKLNIIHRELYGPGKEEEYRLANMNKLSKFPYINTTMDDLLDTMANDIDLQWKDGDTPSNDILQARLRAKMYGGQVITYRHFLRMVLNSRFENETIPNEKISPQIMDFAKKCIVAMFYSAQAFWGMGDKRLIVTNVWGTSHAQWGHVIVLHAAYMNPVLHHHVPAVDLSELTFRVREFLVSVAHLSSALADDIRILDFAAERSGAREAALNMGWVPGYSKKEIEKAQAIEHAKEMALAKAKAIAKANEEAVDAANAGLSVGPGGAGSSFGSNSSGMSAPRI